MVAASFVRSSVRRRRQGVTARRRTFLFAAGVVVLGLCASLEVAVAGATETARRSGRAVSPRELPAVPSAAARVDRPPKPPSGDFSRGPAPLPRPASALKAPPRHRTGFDRATSRVIDSLTSPQQQVFQNSDGSRTANISSGPVRFKGADGKWSDIDLLRLRL